MPPKKGGGAPKGGASSKPAVDKSFGMKNKKGAKQQKQIQVLQKELSQSGKTKEQLAKEKQREAEKKAKAEAEKMRRELAADITIVQPKVPFGVDPKTITCEFWRAGKCDKDRKCKFAHSLDANRKAQKKDLYVDTREQEREEKEADTMDKWDEEKLNKVILSKHGNPKSTTDKVCKYFLQAVEDGKYGWFWECPNGGEKCMYKHRLPPGFVLKSQRKEQEALEKANEISLEEFLEVERHKLGPNLTPVTAESFAKWKKERVDKKVAEEEALKGKKERQAQMNKLTGLSGREMFELQPDMFEDEEDEADGVFDMREYISKDWEQDRQSDEEHTGLSEDEDCQDDENEQDGEGEERGQANGDANGDAHADADATADDMQNLNVNGHGDEGKEEGKRKE
ncbi:hypothetical protein K437DRAFT_236836 [Tilletiaria anomala UBC 951]|uniref:C3H1-type domain-containing protein n=1 Tax=Tilletiaria anomala (strain ATCC 24038 / CBS 436.72 / UBC 951) TaxID=1037660 RepID=A0A066VYR1_TILAU|nr:uncharacterized protein K437DRAFT_236836 [Tilletiaria anomala UBC 951]KDN43949.1 hypothetical protein K437DRAFT_236836 [Tilletiaria anomala UBC 951]